VIKFDPIQGFSIELQPTLVSMDFSKRLTKMEIEKAKVKVAEMMHEDAKYMSKAILDWIVENETEAQKAIRRAARPFGK
jgi:hypothetical protein